MQTVDAAGLQIGDDHPPRIMGVLNISVESPYEPSVFDDPGEAAAYIDRELIDEGADIVDVGLESANKRFEVLSAEEELSRLDTAIAAIESVSGDAVFSIETRYHEVAEAALDRGFEMVNDICGFADPEMPAVCADFDVAVCKMASPPDLERPGAIEDVDEIYEALQRNGLTEKTIVDPAFGGWSEEKTLEDDRETFHRLREFRALGQPILVSINRKNFLRALAGRSTEEALPVSLAATSMAVDRGAHVIRTHDVAETRDAAIVGSTFARDRFKMTFESNSLEIEQLDVTTVDEADRFIESMDPADAESNTEKTDERIGLSKEVIGSMYRIGGLSPAARTRLAELALAADVILVEGTGARESEVILGGSMAGIAELATSVDGPDSLDRVLKAIAESI